MKYDFTDRDLECAAKNVLDALANENKVSPQIRHENNYINVSAAETTHKIRKTIIKTARLYVIAAVLVMILAVLTIQTEEKGLIRLYGCLIFCLISIFLGVIFRICEIYAMRLTHEKE